MSPVSTCDARWSDSTMKVGRRLVLVWLRIGEQVVGAARRLDLGSPQQNIGVFSGGLPLISGITYEEINW